MPFTTKIISVNSINANSDNFVLCYNHKKIRAVKLMH